MRNINIVEHQREGLSGGQEVVLVPKNNVQLNDGPASLA